MGTATDEITAALAEARERTLRLVSGLDEPALEAVHSPLLSPLVWDLGHIAAFEDLWISRTFALPMLESELIGVYDADETPRANRGSLPFLRTDAALEYLARTRAHTLHTLDEHRSDGQDQKLELIIRHELQHNETMAQTLQIAGLPCALAPDPSDTLICDAEPTLLDFSGGPVEIGSARELVFAYDNEQPRHPVELGDFSLARSPVSNANWLEFIADAGYARAALWSAAGWEWRSGERISRPLYWTDDGQRTVFGTTVALNPREPVCHISYFEAEAFARFRELRLPTEFEWERAATADSNDDSARPVGMSDTVWQWTSTEFHGYPGFRADPYPEYSEQFFHHGYRVLRGGAHVSAPRVATPQFRNWDLPQRRQIFSGLRLARDL